MKKIIILLAPILILILSSCYDGNKNATVRINLANIPLTKQIEKKSLLDKVFSIFVQNAYAQASPADLVKLYIAAVKDGEVLTSEDFTREEIDAVNSVVEFPVPSGVNVAIIAVGEMSGGSDFYYDGTYVDLTAGEEVTVNLTMGYLQSRLNFTRAADDTNASWASIPGVVEYALYRNGNEVYRGKSTIWYGDPNTGFDLYVSFGVTEISYNYGW